MDWRTGSVRMKTFKQFSEVYDPEIQGRSQIKKTGQRGEIGRDRRKTEPEKRRVKAVGGGQTASAKSYKDRKDIGVPRDSSDRVQQPTKERGSSDVKQSYADKVKAERKKAAQARIAARKTGGEVKKDTTSTKDKEKAASKMLTKKTTKTVSPDYKPAKASGYTRKERMAIHRKGETIVRNTFKDQETAKYKKETGQSPDAKGRTKIMGRVHKRMSEAVNDPEQRNTYGSGSTPQSGTIGGTKAEFKKRPSTGLGRLAGNLAKRAGDSIKNAGKNTAGSQQKPDGKYRIKNKEATPKPEKGGALAKRADKGTDMVKKAVKTAAQKKLSPAKTRPMLGTAQRPDLTKKKLNPAPTRPQQSQQKAVSGSPQRKAISGGSSGIQKRPESKPATQSGIKPVRVTVLGPKRAGYIGSGDKKKVTGSGSQKALPPAKNNTKAPVSSPNKPKEPAAQKQKVKALPPATSSKGYKRMGEEVDMTPMQQARERASKKSKKALERHLPSSAKTRENQREILDR